MNSMHSSILIMASVRWYNASAHYALFLAEGLKKAGHKVVLFGIPGSPVIKKAEELGIAVFDEINLMNSSPLTYFKNLIKFKNEVQKNGFNIMVTSSLQDICVFFIA